MSVLYVSGGILSLFVVAAAGVGFVATASVAVVGLVVVIVPSGSTQGGLNCGPDEEATTTAGDDDTEA